MELYNPINPLCLNELEIVKKTISFLWGEIYVIVCLNFALISLVIIYGDNKTVRLLSMIGIFLMNLAISLYFMFNL